MLMVSHPFILDQEFTFSPPNVVQQLMQPMDKNIWRPLLLSRQLSVVYIACFCLYTGFSLPKKRLKSSH